MQFDSNKATSTLAQPSFTCTSTETQDNHYQHLGKFIEEGARRQIKIIVTKEMDIKYS